MNSMYIIEISEELAWEEKNFWWNKENKTKQKTENFPIWAGNIYSDPGAQGIHTR